MQKYLLDSSICVFCLRDKFDVQNKILEIGPENCYVSEVTVAELKYGAEYSTRRDYNLRLCDELLQKINILPFGIAVDLFSSEKARLRKNGTPIEDFDLIIGCTSVVSDMIMVTDNTRHFQNIKGIKLENWINR